jgi:hypothetical protein
MTFLPSFLPPSLSLSEVLGMKPRASCMLVHSVTEPHPQLRVRCLKRHLLSLEACQLQVCQAAAHLPDEFHFLM